MIYLGHKLGYLFTPSRHVFFTRLLVSHKADYYTIQLVLRDCEPQEVTNSVLISNNVKILVDLDEIITTRIYVHVKLSTISSTLFTISDIVYGKAENEKVPTLRS